MPRVAFTPHLKRHVDCPTLDVDGDSVRAVLEQVFEQNPKLKGYVLDDRSVVRQHVMIFVDGRPIADRHNQSDPVGEKSEIYVMQALSGG